MKDLDLHREEGRQAHLRTRARLKGLREERLSRSGTWSIEHFSPPGEGQNCDHPYPSKIVRGGLPLYYCDDCEHGMLGLAPTEYLIPKQHLVAQALNMLGWMQAYDGPAAVAMGFIRAHPRLDKPDQPHLPPVSGLLEQAEAWKETFALMEKFAKGELGYEELEQRMIEEGSATHALTEGQSSENGITNTGTPLKELPSHKKPS